VDISFLTDPEDFKKRAGDILRRLRNSAKAPGAQRIYTCGEKEHLAWQERRRSGIPLLPQTRSEMITMRDELGLNHRFPFEG